jgi:hypothetical protein
MSHRALARASGIAAARLAAHEAGRIALDAQELQAVDRVLSPREAELGLPSVRPDYVPAALRPRSEIERYRRERLGRRGKRMAPVEALTDRQRKRRAYDQRRKAAQEQQPAAEPAE